MKTLTTKEEALLAYGYCVGKEVGHHETVEGYFSGCGRSIDHLEDALGFIEDLVQDGVEEALVYTTKQLLELKEG